LENVPLEKAGHFIYLLDLTKLQVNDEMGTACSIYEQNRNVYRILVGKPEDKRPLGRPEPTYEDNIKMDLREI
jgi:hypothetical protein